MSVWTLEQISQIRGLWAEVTVDEASVLSGDDMLDGLKDKLFKELRRLSHPFAVEIDGRDLEFHKARGEKPWRFVIKARWNPSTHDVELHGGHADGQALAVERVGNSIVLPVLNSPAYAMDAEAAYPTSELSRNTVRYDYSGWNESARRWVYSAAGA